MKLFLTLSIGFMFISPTTGFAADRDGQKNHEHIPLSQAVPGSDLVTVLPGEVIVQVKGIVCSFCSQGIQKKLSKLSYIDHSKYNKGSVVDIETQQITIAVKPSETFDLKATYKSIRKGGYVPVKTYVGSTGGTLIYNAEGLQCIDSIMC